MLIYIRKRDGQKAVFDKQKIMTAMKKAFLAVHDRGDDTVLQGLCDQVVVNLEEKYDGASIPSVEHTQDIVELVLMRNGHLDVAKAYILYRAKHKEIREHQRLNDIRDLRLQVLTGSGNRVPFSIEVLRARLYRVSHGLDKVDREDILQAVVRGVYSDMPLSSVEELLISEIKARIEKHYQYSSLAARVVLDKLYNRILGDGYGSEAATNELALRFPDFIAKGVELELLDPQLLEFDLPRLGAALNFQRDDEFLFLGVQTLVDRYLLRERTPERKQFECPQWLWMRVAMGMALKETNREEWAIRFYETLSTLQVVSSTPTLFNSGTTHSQMSSCYLNTVNDSMEGIFKTYADCAQLSKWAGGIGTDWTSIRAKGAFIKGTNGTSQGIIPFLKIYNDVALAVNQGGKRKGAMCAYLELWHKDVEEFLELKKNTGDERRRTHDIHTAVMVPDLFMKRVREKGKWTLFSPDTASLLHTTYGQEFEQAYLAYESQALRDSVTLNALDLWRRLLTMLYETGHPWLTFKDAMNVRSPQDHVGMIHNSNLCTEITLNTSKDETAVCNLASLNLARMVVDGKLDQERVRQAVSVGIRMLDNVIDNNFYPTAEARNANMRHRPIGLGVMGYQDALYQLGLEFDSAENIDFADASMEVISHAAIHASALLAAERGAYPSYQGSKWDRGLFPIDTIDLLEKERGIALQVARGSRLDWTPVRAVVAKYGMRNSNTMAIAPTATISNIAGTVPCVEPSFRNLYMKENLSGNFVVINRWLVDALDKRGLWNEAVLMKIKINNGSVLGIDEIPADIQRLFKETFEIDPNWVIEAAARRAKWIDQSASTNIFIKTTSGRALSDVYMRAWETGLKTTYYLRTLAASQVSRANADSEEASLPPPETSEAMQESTMVLKACSITDPDCEACQ